MKALLGFLPFLAFALLSAMGYSSYGLLAGTAIALLWIVRDALTPGRQPKLLDIGNVVLFGALSVFTFVEHASLSVPLVRIVVDSGLLLIVLITIVVRKPFTMAYAKESVPPALWNHPRFLKTHLVISLAWAAALFLVVLADVALWREVLSRRVVIVLIVGSLYTAARFTQHYAKRARAQAAAQT